MQWDQTLSIIIPIIGSVIAAVIYVHKDSKRYLSKVEEDTKSYFSKTDADMRVFYTQMQEDRRQQMDRTDRLYEMFIDLLKKDK